MQRLRAGLILNPRPKSFYPLKIASRAKNDTVSKNVQNESKQLHDKKLKDINKSIDKCETLQDYQRNCKLPRNNNL